MPHVFPELHLLEAKQMQKSAGGIGRNLESAFIGAQSCAVRGGELMRGETAARAELGESGV